MAKVFIEESTLTSIGNSIRNKTGKTDLIDPLYMSAEIDSISGGGGGDIPEEALNITGDCRYKFAYSGWTWFINNYGNQIKTSDISNAQEMFYSNNTIKTIPFDINTNNPGLKSMFEQCSALTDLPRINISNVPDNIKAFNLSSMNRNCALVKNMENLFDVEQIKELGLGKLPTYWGDTNNLSNLFYFCGSLRRVPSWWYELHPSNDCTYFYSASYTGYYSSFYGCYCLDEFLNMPVFQYTANVPVTSNMFWSSFESCNRAKNFIFETQEDGTPYTVKWKSQTIDFSRTFGYGSGNYTYYGMTEDKRVKDDATYQTLKDDPDWWSTLMPYARYNHDSAVATINSLPDTSAYLAENGGTNTIKFYGAAGSSTDGGAINTLTEEEIAVATAKGWTVTLA